VRVSSAVVLPTALLVQSASRRQSSLVLVCYLLLTIPNFTILDLALPKVEDAATLFKPVAGHFRDSSCSSVDWWLLGSCCRVNPHRGTWHAGIRQRGYLALEAHRRRTRRDLFVFADTAGDGICLPVSKKQPHYTLRNYLVRYRGLRRFHLAGNAFPNGNVSSRRVSFASSRPRWNQSRISFGSANRRNPRVPDRISHQAPTQSRSRMGDWIRL